MKSEKGLIWSTESGVTKTSVIKSTGVCWRGRYRTGV